MFTEAETATERQRQLTCIEVIAILIAYLTGTLVVVRPPPARELWESFPAFLGQIIPTNGATGSAQGPVGLVSISCDWVRY